MKKTIFVAVLALLSCAAVSAQDRERMSDEERAKAIAERIERAADRMAKDFDLKDDAKATFISIYTAYQKEMFATNQSQGQRFEQAERAEEKKQTDEEATAKIQENFSRQEQQIATMQKRLDIQKKYSTEFAKVLTPQQVLKVLTPQRGQGGRGQGQRGEGERRGNFEGGPRGGFGGGARGGFGGPGGGFGGGF